MAIAKLSLLDRFKSLCFNQVMSTATFRVAFDCEGFH